MTMVLKVKAEMVGGSISDGRTRRIWDFDAGMAVKPQEKDSGGRDGQVA